MTLHDRNGAPFHGTKEELRRHNNTLAQRARRASLRRLELQLPAGTGAALDRICARGGFEEPQELLALQIHRLDRLSDAEFDQWVKFNTAPGDLSKYHDQIGAYVAPEVDE